MPQESESQKRMIQMLQKILDDNKIQLDKLQEMSDYLKGQMSDELKIIALEKIELIRLGLLETKKKVERSLQTAIDKQNAAYGNELN